jgi:ABC-type dipeptide/oligopeptide/nickel transport system permease component
MKQLILIISSFLAFITIAFCVFNDVRFTSTLLRGGVVLLGSITIFFIGVSLSLVFSYVGWEDTILERTRPRNTQSVPSETNKEEQGDEN